MEAVFDFLENLGALDALLLTLILVSCGVGMAQGFTAIVFTKLSILAGIWFAFFNGGPVSEMLVQLGVQQQAAGFAAPVLIIFLAGLIGWLTASAVVNILKLLKLGFVNSLLGGCYGFLRVAALILAGTAAAAHMGALDKVFYDRSRIMQASGWALYQIKESDSSPMPIREFLNSFSYDKDNYRPSLATAAEEPATTRRAKRNRGKKEEPHPALSSSSDPDIEKMLERARILKKTSDTVAGRNQEPVEQESEAAKRLRLIRMSSEERIAEALKTGQDEELLEALTQQDEQFRNYLERFKQKAPEPEPDEADELIDILGPRKEKVEEYLERLKQQAPELEEWMQKQ